MKHKLKISLATIGAGAVMLLIYQLSAQPASISDAYSRGIVNTLVNACLWLMGLSIPEPARIRLVNHIDSVAREYMHGVIFMALAMLVQYAALSGAVMPRKAAVITIAVCLTYGLGDEIHQLLVPGRSFQVSDLLMDTMGSLVGIVLVTWNFSRCRHVRALKQADAECGQD